MWIIPFGQAHYYSQRSNGDVNCQAVTVDLDRDPMYQMAIPWQNEIINIVDAGLKQTL